MDTSEQPTSVPKTMTSELVAEELKIAFKKHRSNSVNGGLEQEEKPSTNETSVGEPEKIDVKKLRNMFEGQNKLETPPPAYVPRKRISMPATTMTTVASSNDIPPTKPPITFPKPTIRVSEISRNRPISLLFEPDITSSRNVPRISVDNPLDPPPEEQENVLSSSPSTTVDEPSSITETQDDEPPKSVQAMRDRLKDLSFNQTVQNNRSAPPPTQPVTKPATDLLEAPRPPPPGLPPSPERYLKSQLTSLHSYPSVEAGETNTGDSSLSSNPALSPSNSSDISSFTDEEEDMSAERRIKLRRCVEEVYTTEKTYVSILYVLSVKLNVEVKNTCDKDENLILTFNNTYKPLLGNIQQIYQLHNGMILPEMEDYITGHANGNIWMVLEKHLKVIEVLYKSYYVTYYDTQGKLDELCKANPLINEAMLKCQVHLGNLYPITQLNCPNQRLLRYILCMKTHMKYLDVNSAEYKHTRSIHDELDRIAVRCEEELVISAAQLNELKERLDNKFECIKDHRKLLWHGPAKKQSPRRYLDIAHRYLILFSDCILVCNEESGRKLEIKRELTIRGVTVDVMQGGRSSIIQTNEQTNTAITYYPFRVNAVEKSYEFLTDKESDREIWVKKILQASEDYKKRNITAIELRQSNSQRDEQQLGLRAPAWVNDVDVTRCQNCNNRFRTAIISSRRHHCRCCGHCICGSCSTKKLLLEYCKNEGEVRVCDTCYTHFTGVNLNKNTSVWPKSTRDIDRTILFGDFRAIHSGGCVWIALQEDYQLHVYGARLDLAEEYTIKLPDLRDMQVEIESRTFTLCEITKTHVFTIDSNHQINYDKNDLLDDQMKKSDTKLSFYTTLWAEAMELARSTTLPDWYIRKRDSADSGVSNIG